MATVDERREGCDGCGRTVSLEALTTVTIPDGEAIACCPDCEPHAREAAKRLSSLDRRRDTCDGCAREFRRDSLEDVVLPDGAIVACCPECRTEAPDRGADADEVDAGEHRCGQCGNWADAEPFLVTTVDDRTERVCRDCKDRLEADGVVKEVAMREAEAREILGVEEDATDLEVREAFLRQVKRAHPDKETGSRSAFKLVKRAYDRLN